MLLTRMLGLQVDLKAFYRMASRDSKRRELAEKYRGLKPVRFPTFSRHWLILMESLAATGQLHHV